MIEGHDSSSAGTERQELDRRLTAAMAEAQDGDRAAYESVLRDCVPIVRRVARNQGAATDFLDDVVQDVLVTIHGARATFDPSRSFTAWLTVITQRRTIDVLRKRGRRAAHEVYSPVAFETHAGPDDPARNAERRSEAERTGFNSNRYALSAALSGLAKPGQDNAQSLRAGAELDARNNTNRQTLADQTKARDGTV